MICCLVALLLTVADPADDGGALNARIAAVAAQGGGVVELEPRTYSIGPPLDGKVPNVTLRGVRGATKLVKLDEPAGVGILTGATYSGWTFEGIEFVGNAHRWPNGSHFFTAYLSSGNRLRFERCAFRDLVGGVRLRDYEDVAFTDCDFYGTAPGVFAGGVMDPPAVPGTFFTEGIAVDQRSGRLAVRDSRFHFCHGGVVVNTAVNQPSGEVEVSGCRFRADWWDNPYPLLRFTPTTVENIPNRGFLLTAVGGLKAACTEWNVISFRRDLAKGDGFTSLFVGRVEAIGQPFARAVYGDVIETADGKRGRIGTIESPSVVWVEGWEDASTYEPTTWPDPATPWRLARYYAASTGEKAIDDTSIGLYFEPVNPFTGERAVTDAKLNMSGWPARVLAKTIYSGVHVGGGVRGLDVSHSSFRGVWADQCSAFNLPEGARITANRFTLGHDEDITLTLCPRSVVSGNVHTNTGASILYLAGGAGATVTGNTASHWGLVNPLVGAVDGNGLGATFTANTFSRPSTLSRDWCRCAFTLHGDCTGAVISANTDAASTISTLDVDKTAAPKKAAITARDVPASRISGSGKGNVTLGK